jgi:hypothetical protein
MKTLYTIHNQVQLNQSIVMSEFNKEHLAFFHRHNTSSVGVLETLLKQDPLREDSTFDLNTALNNFIKMKFIQKLPGSIVRYKLTPLGAANFPTKEQLAAIAEAEKKAAEIARKKARREQAAKYEALSESVLNHLQEHKDEQFTTVALSDALGLAPSDKAALKSILYKHKENGLVETQYFHKDGGLYWSALALNQDKDSDDRDISQYYSDSD